MRVVDAKHARPFRPGIVAGSVRWRTIQQLEVRHAFAAVTQRRANAVVARVTTADDDHIKSGGRNEVAIIEPIVEQALCVASEEIHRKMDSLELPPGAAACRVERLCC